MQLLQQPEVNMRSTNEDEEEYKHPKLSYGERTSIPFEYSNDLSAIVEKRAKENVKQKQSVRSLIDLADIHRAKGSYRKAQEYYLKALRLTKNSVQVLRKIIELNVQHGNTEVANRFYNELMKKTENHNDIIDYLNFIILSSNHLDTEKLAIFQSYRRKYDTNPDICNLYGVALLKVGELELSRIEFQSIHKANPDFIHCANNLGVVNTALKDYTEAIENFRSAIAIDKTFIFSYQNLASAYLSNANHNMAIEVLEEARNLGLPLEDKWLGNLAQLKTDFSDDQAMAAQLHKELLEKYPNHPLFLNNLGVNYYRQNEFDKALKCYREAAKNLARISMPIDSKFHGVVLNNLLEASNRFGSTKETSATAEHILKLFPDSVSALVYRVRSLLDEHRLDEARTLSERAYRIDSHHPEIVLNLSYIYSVSELDNNRALDILETFIKEQGNQLSEAYLKNSIFNNIAYNLIKVGRIAESKQYIDKLTDDPLIKSTKALYLLHTNKPKKAIELYNESFEQFEDSFNRDMNILFSKYELAKYFSEKRDYSKALRYIDDGLEFHINKKVRQQLNQLRFSISEHEI